jgi:hypothetical protein
LSLPTQETEVRIRAVMNYQATMRNGVAAAMITLASICGAMPSASADQGDGLAGDPDNASQYWAPQSLTDDCSLMSVTDVVGQLTGGKPSEEEIINVASTTPSASHPGPIYTPPTPDNPASGQGTWLADLPILLGHYGLGSTYTNDVLAGQGGLPTGIPALVDDLNAGKRIIVSLNWQTIWDHPGDRTKHNHAVVVTGVDTSNGIVLLNDSAFQGPNEPVALGTFDTSWQTSARGMVVAG